MLFIESKFHFNMTAIYLATKNLTHIFSHSYTKTDRKTRVEKRNPLLLKLMYNSHAMSETSRPCGKWWYTPKRCSCIQQKDTATVKKPCTEHNGTEHDTARKFSAKKKEECSPRSSRASAAEVFYLYGLDTSFLNWRRADKEHELGRGRINIQMAIADNASVGAHVIRNASAVEKKDDGKISSRPRERERKRVNGDVRIIAGHCLRCVWIFYLWGPSFPRAGSVTVSDTEGESAIFQKFCPRYEWWLPYSRSFSERGISKSFLRAMQSGEPRPRARVNNGWIVLPLLRLSFFTQCAQFEISRRLIN